jgi:hypothetical protein
VARQSQSPGDSVPDTGPFCIFKEQRDSRIRLSQEFHRLIAGIVLHPAKQRSAGRYVTVHLKADAWPH